MKSLLFIAPILIIGAFSFSPKQSFFYSTKDTLYIYSPNCHDCGNKNCFYKGQILFDPQDYEWDPEHEQFMQFRDKYHFAHPQIPIKECTEICRKLVNTVTI